jgi:hypothetical protein
MQKELHSSGLNQLKDEHLKHYNVLVDQLKQFSGELTNLEKCMIRLIKDNAQYTSGGETNSVKCAFNTEEEIFEYMKGSYIKYIDLQRSLNIFFVETTTQKFVSKVIDLHSSKRSMSSATAEDLPVIEQTAVR